jgi:hypothetical protein
MLLPSAIRLQRGAELGGNRDPILTRSLTALSLLLLALVLSLRLIRRRALRLSLLLLRGRLSWWLPILRLWRG